MSQKLEVSRTERAVMQIGIEALYGSEPEELVQLPIYDVRNPLQAQFRKRQIRRAHSGLAEDRIVQKTASNSMSGKILMYGSGTANDPPPWAKLLEISGFQKLVKTDYTLYTPESECWKSAETAVFLDSYRHRSQGVRGTFTINAQAGRFAELNFNLQGRYLDPDVLENPADSAPASIPPIVCGDGIFTIKGEDFELTPVFKGLSINPGVRLTQRLEARSDDQIAEIELTGGRAARWACQIEVDKRHNFFEQAREDDTFILDWTHGEGVGSRWNVTTEVSPGERTAFLARAPRYSDANGIRTWDLEFLLSGFDSDYLQFRHF